MATDESREQRLKDAERDFRRLEEEVAPFLKKRNRKRTTTAGQWQITRRGVERPIRTQSQGRGAN